MADDPKRVLGSTIREMRLKLELSQERLAELSGLHWTYIGGIERGERNVSLMNIVKIAKALKTTAGELLARIK